MKRMILVVLLVALLWPVSAWSARWEWNETGYQREEATGFLRNATGQFQGPGGSAGLLYGPLARVKRDSGFTLVELWKWHGGIASRLGGDPGPEGSKVSFVFGAAPVTLMGVSFIADYNPTDGAFVWGAVTSLNGLWGKLTQ